MLHGIVLILGRLVSHYAVRKARYHLALHRFYLKLKSRVTTKKLTRDNVNRQRAQCGVITADYRTLIRVASV